MTDLDIRLGVTGLRLENKADLIEEINATLNEYREVLTIPCDTKEVYKLYKDIRKKMKDDRSEIKSSIKDKVNDYTSDIINDQKELYDMYEELYNNIDAAIKAYEEENEVGAAKAKMTRMSHKAEEEAKSLSLTLSLSCPSEEVKSRIIQFATDLGATVL